MTTEKRVNDVLDVNHGYDSNRMRRRVLVSLCMILGTALSLAMPAKADIPTYDDDATYPPLCDLSGADITGEVDIIIYLMHGRAVVEKDGMLYHLDDRPLEVGFDQLTRITLHFILPDSADPTTLFTTRDEQWTETLEIQGGALDYVIYPNDAWVYSFEIGGPGQPAPTVPDIVLKPIKDAPPPQ